MNRKLMNLVKASFFALPFALPVVAFAQSAGGSSSGTIGATDNTSTRSATSTTTTQTGTYNGDDSGNLGIDRDGNSTRDNNPVPSSTGLDQTVTKQKTVQKHVRTPNDDGTATTSDTTSSATSDGNTP